MAAVTRSALHIGRRKGAGPGRGYRGVHRGAARSPGRGAWRPIFRSGCSQPAVRARSARFAGDATKLPFGDAYSDRSPSCSGCVMSSTTKRVREMARVTRPGGRCGVRVLHPTNALFATAYKEYLMQALRGWRGPCPAIRGLRVPRESIRAWPDRRRWRPDLTAVGMQCGGAT